jgi:hypothetical protein
MNAIEDKEVVVAWYGGCMGETMTHCTGLVLNAIKKRLDSLCGLLCRMYWRDDEELGVALNEIKKRLDSLCGL